MENRQYNLRSANRDTIQVPVQLQVGNTEFMSTVMNQNNDSHSDSISDSNDSHSDLDCSGLLNLSNDENHSKLPVQIPQKLIKLEIKCKLLQVVLILIHNY